MAHVLPELPWAKDALVPNISAETIEFHYGKHHQGYVTKLNALVKGTPHENKTLEQLVHEAEGGIFNCAAQTWNHTFYWHSMCPKGGKEPHGKIKELIDRDFGNFEAFKKAFTDAAIGHFGSGWAWLVQSADGKLKVHQTHDAGCPLRDGAGKPILVVDVWEHAYYVDYRNARDKYVAAWWNVVSWDFANKNLSVTSSPRKPRL